MPETCSVCGKPFTDKQRTPFIEQDNLFGGHDRVCKLCALRQERRNEELPPPVEESAEVVA